MLLRGYPGAPPPLTNHQTVAALWAACGRVLPAWPHATDPNTAGPGLEGRQVGAVELWEPAPGGLAGVCVCVPKVYSSLMTCS